MNRKNRKLIRKAILLFEKNYPKDKIFKISCSELIYNDLLTKGTDKPNCEQVLEIMQSEVSDNVKLLVFKKFFDCYYEYRLEKMLTRRNQMEVIEKEQKQSEEEKADALWERIK